LALFKKYVIRKFMSASDTAKPQRISAPVRLIHELITFSFYELEY